MRNQWPFTIVVLLFLTATIATAEPKLGLLSRTFINFGSHPLKANKKQDIKVRNDGNAPLKLGPILKSCSCTNAKIKARTLKPGEMTDITVFFVPYSIKGKYRKLLSVKTNDPKKPFIRITVVGTSEPLVNVNPEDSYYPRYMPIGKIWKQAFSLQAMQSDVKLAEPKVTSNYPTVLKKTAENVYDGGKLMHYELKITPARNGPDLDCKIVYDILSPEGWKPIVVTVKARIGLRLYAFPSRLSLDTGKKAGTQDFQLRLLGDNTKKFDIGKISWDKIPGLSLSFGTQHGITLPVTASFDDKFLTRLKKEKSVKIILKYPESNATSVTFTAVKPKTVKK